MLPIIRMSSSGYCARRLSARMLGTHDRLPDPPWLASAAREGKMHEPILKQQLRDLGCSVTDEQEEVVLHYDGFDLVGHLDGEIKLSREALDSDDYEVIFVNRPHFDLDTYYPLEVKTFSFNEARRWWSGGFEAFPNYADQFTCYMFAKCSSIGVYLTKDRSGGRKRLYVLGQPPSIMADISTKLVNVNDSIAHGELVAGDYDPSVIECRRCEYRTTICKPEAIVIEDEYLEEVLAKYVANRKAERDAKTVKEQCRELIIGYGSERFKMGRYVVVITWVDREGISLKDLLQVVPRDQIDDIITQSHFPRLTVTDTEDLL